MKKIVDIIAGARPNFIKIAPIIHAFEKYDQRLGYRLIHTGQHYDKNMSGSFFDQLRIPLPHINLEVGSGTQAQQTAEIMQRYERVLVEKPSDLCLVVGDVTSTMACAIVARKRGIEVAHVEGGLRSGDWTMPEEINRVVTDSISNYFFTTSENANRNLAKEGIEANRIFFVGNTMIDTLVANLSHLRPPDFWSELGLKKNNYLVLTLHRPANVDDPSTLHSLLHEIEKAGKDFKIIFPVHPRTREKLSEWTALTDLIYLVSPLPYFEFNFLVKNAKAVLTDSGGITEETTYLGVPCFTLRDNTERPETISIGSNTLLGTNPENIRPALTRFFQDNPPVKKIPPLWDGKTGQRIADVLFQKLINTISETNEV